MIASELMIGDWVLLGDTPIRLKSLNLYSGDDSMPRHYYAIIEPQIVPHNCWIEIMQPIPLTPEILKKNGFTNKHSCGNYCLRYSQYKDNDGNYDLYICNGIRECGEINEYQFTAMRYVHELQHALRLCGINKEIVL